MKVVVVVAKRVMVAVMTKVGMVVQVVRHHNRNIGSQ